MFGRRPPHLVVRGVDDPFDFRAWDGAANGHVKVHSQTSLRFNSAKVLNLKACNSPQVLHKAVDGLGEVDGVLGGTFVVVVGRVDRRPIGEDATIRVESDRDEEGRSEHPGRQAR